MKKDQGFTVLELIMAIIILLAAGTIFFFQKEELNAQHRDDTRKIAINSIYYNLEEVIYPSLNGYPAKLDASQLKAMDAELLKDSTGIMINDTNSQYHYEPSSCNGDVCQHYVLRATLEKEADFVKTSKN